MWAELIFVLSLSQLNNCVDQGKWADGIVPFFLHPSLTENEVKIFKDTVELINSKLKGCLHIRPRLESEPDFVYVTKPPNYRTNPSFCKSHVGRQGGFQPMYVTEECLNHSKRLHRLFLHVIGLQNEVVRPDRDTYIEINEDNVDPRFKHYLKVCKDCPTYGEYDPESVLHFPSDVFTLNGADTITVGKKLHNLDFQNMHLGLNDKMSEKDAMKIRQMYGCTQRKCKFCNTLFNHVGII